LGSGQAEKSPVILGQKSPAHDRLTGQIGPNFFGPGPGLGGPPAHLQCKIAKNSTARLGPRKKNLDSGIYA